MSDSEHTEYDYDPDDELMDEAPTIELFKPRQSKVKLFRLFNYIKLLT